MEFWVKDVKLHLPESKATLRGLSRILAWEECKSLVVFAKLWGPIWHIFRIGYHFSGHRLLPKYIPFHIPKIKFIEYELGSLQRVKTIHELKVGHIPWDHGDHGLTRSLTFQNTFFTIQ